MSGLPAGTPQLTRPLTRSRLPMFAGLVGIGIAQAAATIATATLVRSVFRSLVSGRTATRPGTEVLLAGGLLLAVVVAAGSRAAERIVAERLGQHYITELRAAMFDHLTRVPARRLGLRKRGNMLLRFVGDLTALSNWVSLGLARLLVAGVALTLAVGALAVIDLGIGVGVGSVLVLGAVATWEVNPRLQLRSRQARRQRARLTGEVTERLTHLGVLQAAGQEHRERRRVGLLSSKLSDAMVARAWAAGLARAVAEGTAGLVTMTVLLVGAVEVRGGRASAGTVVGALAVTGLLAGHLRDLGRVAEYAAAAKVARAAAERFLALPTLPDQSGLPALPAGGGCLELESVGWEGALAGVTVRCEAGQTIAIVGGNGAGKSTLVALAARLFDPDEGRVLLDGQDLRECSLSSVRARIGLAGPDLPLLRGTVERNVRYRRPRASDAEFARVRELCELDELIADLPDGWASEVGDGGSLLSAGQRARILVARAILGRPRLLVLDEAEAHLDRSAADMLDRVLAAHDGTALVVTHRRDLVARADVVWCLQNGQLVEVGPPGPLLAGNGLTARLLASGRAYRPRVPHSVSPS